MRLDTDGLDGLLAPTPSPPIWSLPELVSHSTAATLPEVPRRRVTPAATTPLPSFPIEASRPVGSAVGRLKLAAVLLTGAGVLVVGIGGGERPVAVPPPPAPDRRAVAAEPSPKPAWPAGGTALRKMPEPAPRIALLPAPGRASARKTRRWRLAMFFPLNQVRPIVQPGRFGWQVRALQACTGTLVVIGHTCSGGPRARNDILGLARAVHARDRLVKAGIPDEKLRVETAGSRHPAVSNGTEQGRRINRRVTVRCDE